MTPGDEPLMAGLTGGMPRFFSASHSRAARSLFDADAEAWLVETAKITPLPWQRAVLTRAFEVDEDGRLCWRVVIVSVGRQSGKTWLIRMLVLLRQRLFAHEEPQSILHLARTTLAARPVILNEPLVRWARSQDIYVRQSNGQEQWRWPDDSTWDLSALDAAYGRTANLVMLDEVWDITRRRYFEAVQPTMAARQSAQVWMFSAAHREATELTPLMIERAREGRDGYMLADWGALPGEDLTDPEVWRAMGPHWDENRRIVIADAVGEEAFEQQWDNRWPDVLGRALSASPFPSWASMPLVGQPDPPHGALVALDEFYDASGAAVAAFDGSGFWYRETADVRSAVALAQRWTDGEVLVGFSLRHAVAQMGLRHVRPVGAKETSLGTPLLLDAVKRLGFAHEHTEALSEQAAGARLKVSDAGAMSLSVKSSAGSVSALKLAAWLLLADRDRPTEAAAIW